MYINKKIDFSSFIIILSPGRWTAICGDVMTSLSLCHWPTFCLGVIEHMLPPHQVLLMTSTYWTTMGKMYDCWLIFHHWNYQCWLNGVPDTYGLDVLGVDSCVGVSPYLYLLKSIFKSNLVKSFSSLLNCQILLECCTEHGSNAAMLCATFQKDYHWELWTDIFFCLFLLFLCVKF